MTKQVDPHPAAVRAAVALLKFSEGQRFVEANAAIIHAEYAFVPELIAALEEVERYMPSGEPSKGNGLIDPEGWQAVLGQVTAALDQTRVEAQP